LQSATSSGSALEGAETSEGDSSTYLGQTTISLQASKMTYNVDNFSDILYTVSWYYEPIQNQTVYSIELINGELYSVANGTASLSTPASGYEAFYSNKTYNYAKITYNTRWVKVPIVEVSS